MGSGIGKQAFDLLSGDLKWIIFIGLCFGSLNFLFKKKIVGAIGFFASALISAGILSNTQAVYDWLSGIFVRLIS
jgi:hypothetical protein